MDLGLTGRVFMSYVTEDSRAADRLRTALERAGIPVWHASEDLAPGADWRHAIRAAIADDAVVFLACFSRAGLARAVSYQREELNLAIEQSRQRSPEVPWLIPVRFDDCIVPDWDIGAGRTLRSLQYADLFGDRREAELARLVAFVRDAVGQQATIGIPSPPKRRLPGRPPRIAVAAAVLAVAAGVIAAILAASDGPGPGRGSMTVPGRPWATTRGDTVRSELAVGNTVRYAFEVDNSTGRRINANVRFDAYWGTRDESPVSIFNLLFSRTIPPGISTVYSPRTRVPAGALPGMYTEQADISDRDYPADRAGQYGFFAVTGRKLLAVPFLPLSGASEQFAVADGPACVAMVLGSYPGVRRPAVLGVRDFIAASSPDRDPAAGEALEYALEHFGVPDGAISQISLDESGLPQAQVTAMAIAVGQGSPVIAFVDAADLPASGARGLSGTGRWIVVVGFEFSATSGTEVLVDDPGAGARSGGGQAQPVGLAAFGRSVAGAAGLPAAQQEPGHIAGIVVAPGGRQPTS
jgi:hypothetical protein